MMMEVPFINADVPYIDVGNRMSVEVADGGNPTSGSYPTAKDFNLLTDRFKKLLIYDPQENLVTQSDRLSITKKNGWINDTVINEMQNRLKKRFPFMGGLEKVHLGWTDIGFSRNKQRDAIQIINTSPSPGHHWVTFCNWHSKVLLYDSANVAGKKCNPDVTWAMFNALRPNNDHVVYTMACTQQEDLSPDCGVFSIANAVALAYGINPSHIKFADRKAMRQHLLFCLDRGYITPFPCQTWDYRYENDILDRQEVQVCVLCAMPAMPGKMLNKCDLCSKKFHSVCRGEINMKAPRTRNMVYNMYCTACADSLNNFP